MESNKPLDQFEFYQSHPPRCLTEFHTSPAMLEEVEFDGHGQSGSTEEGFSETVNPIFSLACKCGGTAFNLIAESNKQKIRFHETVIIAERFLLHCKACDSKKTVFNPSVDGYDNEAMRLLKTDDEETVEDRQPKTEKQINTSKTVQGKCKNCGQATFAFFIRFEYFADLFDDESFEGKQQDYFSWITVYGKCEQCSHETLFVDYECA